MTWVVAASTVFGYGALYSDVRVSFEDGHSADLLQKAYPVGQSTAAGFAGSVKIGCMLIESLINHLTRIGEAQIHERIACVRQWSQVARAVVQTAEPSEQALQSRILVVGASPSESPVSVPPVAFVRFESPMFEPQVMLRPIKVCGIGSGAGVAEYKETIRPLMRLTSGLLKAEIGKPGGWGLHLGHTLSRKVGKGPQHGISRHLHVILVSGEGFMAGTTDQIDHHSDGTTTEYKMPMVARSYGDFLALAKASGHAAARAQC